MISDGRFQNEIDSVLQRGGVCYVLKRKMTDLQPLKNEHESENDFLARLSSMDIIENTGDSLQDLYKKVDDFIVKKTSHTKK